MSSEEVKRWEDKILVEWAIGIIEIQEGSTGIEVRKDKIDYQIIHTRYVTNERIPLVINTKRENFLKK